MHYHCGLDFGTSNSVISILEDNGVSVGDVDREPVRESVDIVAREPSVIFFPKQGICESLYFVGEDAIAAYLEHQMQGRFIQSLKSLLSDLTFAGTIINKRPYTPSDLVTVILAHLKQKAEIHVGQPITSVVLGRPVYFGSDPAQDKQAELSLKNAARMAGFREIFFQYEPIAAALAYEAQLTRPEIVMVADLGGGTTDFTVMRLDPHSMARKNRKDDILATDGVDVGGNKFDSGIMWTKLVTQFGYGSSYESWGKYLEVPVHIFRTLCRWEQIAFLKTSKYREELRYFLSGSSDRPAINRLITLIDKNLGYSLFKSIEAAKISLAEWDAAQIEFDHDGVAIQERLTAPELNRIILPDLKLVSKSTDRVLAKSGLTEDDISTVFLTGGSSLVRRIQTLFKARFGNDKVKAGSDTFTSVATGLAIYKKYNFQNI